MQFYLLYASLGPFSLPGIGTSPGLTMLFVLGKVVTHLLLMKMSTVDLISALQILAECQLQHLQGMLSLHLSQESI